MDQFLEKFSVPKLNQEEIEIMKPTENIEIKTNKKSPMKSQGQMASQVNSIRYIQKVNAYTFETIPNNCSGKKTSKLIL